MSTFLARFFTLGLFFPNFVFSGPFSFSKNEKAVPENELIKGVKQLHGFYLLTNFCPQLPVLARGALVNKFVKKTPLVVVLHAHARQALAFTETKTLALKKSSLPCIVAEMKFSW